MLGIAWPSMRASLDAPFAGLGLLVAAMTRPEPPLRVPLPAFE